MKFRNTIIVICLVLIFLIIISLGFRLGYGNRSGILYCSYHNKLIYIEFTNKYVIEYKDRYVTKISTYEEVDTEDDSELLNYKTKLEENYSKYKDLKYYNNQIIIKKDKIISKTIINYSKINVNDLLKVDDSLKKYFTKDNKLKITDIKKLYEKNDVRCVYK